MACWMTLSCTVGMPSIREPPFGLGISTRLTATGMYRPSRMCAQMLAPCFSKCARISLTVIPSTPGAPLLAITRLHAVCMFSGDSTSSSVISGYLLCSSSVQVCVPLLPTYLAALLRVRIPSVPVRGDLLGTLRLL